MGPEAIVTECVVPRIAINSFQSEDTKMAQKAVTTMGHVAGLRFMTTEIMYNENKGREGFPIKSQLPPPHPSPTENEKS